MSKFPWTIVENHGGLAGSPKMGPEHSFAYGRALDFRTDPTSITMAPAPVKDSGTIVTGLIVDMICLPSGKFVAIDNAGGVYTRTAGIAGTWTKLGTTLTDVAVAAGMHYNLQQDMIYIPGSKNIHTITNADGRFGGSITVNNNALTRTTDQSATTSTNTYATTGAVSEATDDKLSITPTIEPMGSIKLWVTTKGTGPLVVTLHDAANNQLAQETVPNASLTNGQLNEIVFTNQIRNTVKPNASTYHVHVHHPSGTAHTIGCATANKFSTARHETLVDMLIGSAYGNGMHPTIEFLQYMLIGNERYVLAWEILSPGTPTNNELLRHRLVLEPGYAVTSFALWGEYVCVAAENRRLDAGRLYFWDGVSAGWNFAVDTPEGSPYSAFAYGNVIHYIAAGKLWATAGSKPIGIAQFPNTLRDSSGAYSMINYPYTMAVLNSLLQIGFASDTDDRNIEHGVYSYGAWDKNYDPSFGFSHVSSQGGLTHGAAGTDEINVGMVRVFGSLMFISYRDGASYFVDRLDPTTAKSDTEPSRYESLIYDAGRPDKEKEALYIRLDLSPSEGADIRMYYKIDREASWQTDGVTYTTDNERFLQMHINKRFHELQIAWEMEGADAPDLLAATVMIETLASEAD